MRSQRQLRVGEEIRHIIASTLQRGDVPWPRGFSNGEAIPLITVTEVQVSPDLKNATVFILPLGSTRLKETSKAMNEIAGFFRHEIAQNVKLRYAPKIRFSADDSFDKAERIEEILRDPTVAKDLEPDQEEE